jgi:assimilatory nitrate reductase catalytic subunit
MHATTNIMRNISSMFVLIPLSGTGVGVTGTGVGVAGTGVGVAGTGVGVAGIGVGVTVGVGDGGLP